MKTEFLFFFGVAILIGGAIADNSWFSALGLLPMVTAIIGRYKEP